MSPLRLFFCFKVKLFSFHFANSAIGKALSKECSKLLLTFIRNQSTISTQKQCSKMLHSNLKIRIWSIWNISVFIFLTAHTSFPREVGQITEFRNSICLPINHIMSGVLSELALWFKSTVLCGALGMHKRRKKYPSSFCRIIQSSLNMQIG